MTPVHVFDVASRQADWLSVRQAAIANNIANANVSTYQATDVAPFAEQMQIAQVRLQATQASHIGFEAGGGARAQAERAVAQVVGGPVVLEAELAKSGEVRAGMELNTAIVSAFHRMTIMVSRG